jgi:hypothetical protein
MFLAIEKLPSILVVCVAMFSIIPPWQFQMESVHSPLFSKKKQPVILAVLGSII